VVSAQNHPNKSGGGLGIFHSASKILTKAGTQRSRQRPSRAFISVLIIKDAEEVPQGPKRSANAVVSAQNHPKKSGGDLGMFDSASKFVY